MLLSDFILLLAAIAAIASLYLYSKEKKNVREFVKQSRRHQVHKELDLVLQKKADRYFLATTGFILIVLFVLIQKWMEQT